MREWETSADGTEFKTPQKHSKGDSIYVYDTCRIGDFAGDCRGCPHDLDVCGLCSQQKEVRVLVCPTSTPEAPLSEGILWDSLLLLTFIIAQVRKNCK